MKLTFTNFHSRGSGRTVAEGSLVATTAYAHHDRKYLYVLSCRVARIDAQNAQVKGLFPSNVTLTSLDLLLSNPNLFRGVTFNEVFLDHEVVERLLVAHDSTLSENKSLREQLAQRDNSVKALIAELQTAQEARDRSEKHYQDLAFFYNDLREKAGVMFKGWNPKSEAEPATDSSPHAFPVGTKVRLVNNNTMGKQWGTVVQQLINGQYLVENTWLKEMYPTNPEKQEPTYQICNENQLRDIADEMTASDFEIGDKVCLWSQLHHAQSWLAVHEVVAKTPTKIVVRPTASHDQSGEILTDPANWVLVPADYEGKKIQ